MITEKQRLPDSELIRLYESGMSQKDISGICDVSHSYLRDLLQNSGFETRTFRSLDPTAKRVVLTLVKRGIEYKDIERVCDISFHAVRELVIRSNLQGESKRVRLSMRFTSLKGEFPQKEAFLELYRLGISFCSACKVLDLSTGDMAEAYYAIQPETIEVHRSELAKHIHADRASGLSDVAIGRKRMISKAIAGKY